METKWLLLVIFIRLSKYVKRYETSGLGREYFRIDMNFEIHIIYKKRHR